MYVENLALQPRPSRAALPKTKHKGGSKEQSYGCFYGSWFPGCQHRFPGLTHRVPDSIGPGQSLRICISNHS